MTALDDTLRLLAWFAWLWLNASVVFHWLGFLSGAGAT